MGVDWELLVGAIYANLPGLPLCQEVDGCAQHERQRARPLLLAAAHQTGPAFSEPVNISHFLPRPRPCQSQSAHAYMTYLTVRGRVCVYVYRDTRHHAGGMHAVRWVCGRMTSHSRTPTTCPTAPSVTHTSIYLSIDISIYLSICSV